jgi:hypothetical protein
MILTGIRSDRYSRRISGQSSTLNTHFPLTSTEVSITEGVSFQLPLGGQFSGAVDSCVFRPGGRACRAAGTWPAVFEDVDDDVRPRTAGW